MEEKDIQIPQIKIKRRVSIFKKRKKSDIRPFVKEAKNRKFKAILKKLLLIFAALLVSAGVMGGIRFYVLPYFFQFKNGVILSPVDKTLETSDIESEIKKSGLDIDNIEFSKDQSLVTFKLHREVVVRLDPKGDIKKDMVLLKEIDNQMIERNIRAIYIDLRYNKPIVKF